MGKVLAFAQDGFYVETSSGDGVFQGLPSTLHTVLYKATKVYAIAVGTNESYLCSWKDKDSKVWRSGHGLEENYPDLHKYLNDRDNEKKFDEKSFETFHFWLGPNTTFYINNQTSGQYHRVAEPALRKELDSRLSESVWPYDPTSVSIGVDQSYVIMGLKGDIVWDLKGHYQTLDKSLREAKDGFDSIVLSPFSGEHYHFLSKDGSQGYGDLPWMWDLPTKLNK